MLSHCHAGNEKKVCYVPLDFARGDLVFLFEGHFRQAQADRQANADRQTHYGTLLIKKLEVSLSLPKPEPAEGFTDHPSS